MGVITLDIVGERVGVDAAGTRHWGTEEFVRRNLRLRRFDVAWRGGEGVLTFRATGQTMRVAVVESGNSYHPL